MTATDAAEQRGAAGAAESRDGRERQGAHRVTGWFRGTATARVAVALTVLPIVVASVRGIARGWLPVGENALFQILARDVFSDHPPLLGLRSSASLITDAHVHHPGPLLFDLLALPVLLFDGPGVAVGMALINSACVLLIAWAAWRRGGPLLTAGAMAVTSGLLWSMGSELLFDPWNPYGVLLPFLAFLLLVWCIGAGDAAALPFAAIAGSLALQTHLSYGLLVPVLGACGVVALLAAARRAPPGDPVRQGLRKWAAPALVVLLLCWAQPLGQQLFGDGPGNLTELVASSGQSGTSVGFRLGARLTASVLTDPPLFLRPSFREGWVASNSIVVDPGDADLPSFPFAVGSLTLLAIGLVALAWAARRRRDGTIARAALTALLTLVAALATAARAPLGDFGVPMHLYRWLWPVSTFIVLVVLMAVLRWVPKGGAGAAALVATVFAGALSVANLPTSDQGSIASPESMEAVEDLNDQLGALEGAGPFLVVMPEGFNEQYAFAIMAELQRRDIRFFVEADWDRQVGRHRLVRAGAAPAALRVATGTGARLGPQGLERVAFHDGLDSDEHRQLERTRAAMEDAARAGDFELNQAGRAAVRRGELPSYVERFDEAALQRLLAARGMAALVEEGWLDVDPQLQEKIERHVELQEHADAFTVAIFLDRNPVVKNASGA